MARPDLVLKQCDRLEVTGWGRTREGGPSSPDLMKATVPFIDTAVCNAPDIYNGDILPRMMCAGFDEGGVDACQGDSGGPLVYRGPDGPVLVGVVSWGEGCARKMRYGVYTRTVPYGDWITAVITGTYVAVEKPATVREVTAEAWIKSVMDNKQAAGSLYLFKFKDPIYVLQEPITWKANGEKIGDLASVTAPKGFVTDLASVPRIFWSALRPDGTYAHAAVLHDYLYWQQQVPREVADEVLRRDMTDLKVDSRAVWTIYTAVRTFGERAWKDNAQLKASGEKRILKSIPTDPSITWAEWKANAGVFAP